MSSSGSGYKGGTVYDGPLPAVRQGTVYSGPPAGASVYKGGTVYSGGTAYNGPASAPAIISSQTGARSIGTSTTNVTVSKGAGVLLAIAIVTGAKALLAYAGVSYVVSQGDQANGVSPLGLLTANLVAAGVFALLWVFARRGSKAAFLIGMLLYGLDLVLLLAAGPAEHIAAIVVHGLFLYYLVNGFRQLA